MPELAEDMYCSQQICIPPTFPYILRQFAKAAIRTQPNDLLTWSTAYFRCLSLNIPPPIKQRLEYPTLRDYYGMTPGWLKALLKQLETCETITFKLLWDRWIGACLKHDILVQILCLGGFTDNRNIPCLRFIGLCAAFLTDNLTQTMILICEIVTEEPEGGSAMILADVFKDIYRFLAKIDASHSQLMKNFYFTDSILSLFAKETSKDQLSGMEIAGEMGSEESTIIQVESMEDVKKAESVSIVSCPSVAKDEYLPIDDYLKGLERRGYLDGAEEEGGKDGQGGDQLADASKKDASLLKIKADDEIEDVDKTCKKVSLPMDEELFGEGGGGGGGGVVEDEEGGEEEEVGTGGGDATAAMAEEAFDGQEMEQAGDVQDIDNATIDIEEKKADEEGVPVGGGGAEEIGATAVGDEENKEIVGGDLEKLELTDDISMKSMDTFDTAKQAKLDEHCLERLRAMQQELIGETDDELEKLKKEILSQFPARTESQEAVVKHFTQTLDEKLIGEAGEYYGEGYELDLKKQTKEYEDIYVDAVPGIGGVVSDELIDAVCEYIDEMAERQEGMFMPRNIRHYSCPPLEILQY